MISHWAQATDRARRPRLAGDRDADVCIVGAGFTGLWTAYELLRAAPALDVVVVEAESVGFGASGRNGGWVFGAMAGARKRWERRGGRAGVVAQEAAIRETVDHIGAVLADERIDCDFVKGGTLRIAQNPVQQRRLEQSIAADRAWGVGSEDTMLLDAASLAARLRIPGATGAVFTPHCARVQPAKLAEGLAVAAEQRGATIYEEAPAESTEAGVVSTPHGVVRAGKIVRATEGYTAGLPGKRRALLPMRSSMIATAPLPADAWAEIGWEGRETMRDGRHHFVYIQRTADDRIAIGGRGIPYRFASDTGAEGALDEATATQLRTRLVELFPAAAEVPTETTWHGVLGASRSWTPAVGFDPASGIGWAGGYVGEGVAAANLAARTLRDLILGEDTELTSLPWVGPIGRRWEPEPLRWLGVHSVYSLLRLADAHENRTGKASPFAVPGRMLGATH